jgi:putative CocE/NonD family hydrolase
LSKRKDGRAEGKPYPLPAGPHATRLEENIFIPMRDGVKLATDLYFPIGAAVKLPAILIRTPYGKREWCLGTPKGEVVRMFASNGYVVAVQDKRGRFQSQGEYTLAFKDDVDGCDTIEWLAKQNWSTGRIGTYGCSDRGDAQVWLAPTRPAALAAMVPQASGSSVGPAGNRYRYFGAFKGGALQLAAAADWMINNGSKIAEHHGSKPTPPVTGEEIDSLLWTLPVCAMLQRVGRTHTDWESILSHGLADPWWDQFPYLKGSEKIDVPALFVNSWADFGVNETLFEFDFFRTHSLSQRSASNQFVIISPSVHCRSEVVSAPTIVGARDLGDARKDFWSIYLRWYAYWLKGEQNEVTRMPRVQYYLMGRNEWRAAESWPPPGTRFRRYFLHSAGRANSRCGDGMLSTQAPKSEEPADTYTYDPQTPVPTGTGAGLPEGFFDQRAVEARDDVLVYSTAPLRTGVEVTGPIVMRLYVSSSAPDTDFTVKLVDVYPDGRAFNVQDGILRVRYREGFDKSVLMKPGNVYPIDVSLDASSNFFDVGHRIRVEVSSSNFPRYDRNLNTGGDNFAETRIVVARNTVHHARDSASYITLPVVYQRR